MEGRDVGVARRAGARGRSPGAHGRSVGRPNSSWLNQLPSRPIACASATPGAMASPKAPGRDARGGGRRRSPRARRRGCRRGCRGRPARRTARATGSCEVAARAGDHVVEPGADDAGRHRRWSRRRRPCRSAPPRATQRRSPMHDRDDDAEDDARRRTRAAGTARGASRPATGWAGRPGSRAQPRSRGAAGCRRTPAASSAVRARTASGPPSRSADTSARADDDAVGEGRDLRRPAHRC